MATIENVFHDKLEKYKIDILHPKTIQDKINWLIAYDTTPLKGVCADKIRIREYCKMILGQDICVPLVKVYNSPSEIKLSDLPNKFVIKTNHGFNMNIICKDKSKFNLQKHIKDLEKWMKTNFGLTSGQPHYAYITPRILVEELLEDEKQRTSLYDYKFWCFNGQPKIWTINDGHGHGDIMYYDMNGNPDDLYGVGKKAAHYEKPEGFDTMVEYATRLASRFKFVRVDFYEVGGKIYLGELTFTPGNGQFKYKSKADDIRIGGLLNLNTEPKYDEGVSVCLTGYKVGEYIEETLNSVYNQTWFKTHDKWEVILGIDGCMETLNKVRSIMHKYKNLRVLMMNSNCGTYVTTNTIMSQAKYSWLVRFDGDDIMLPELIETVMKGRGDADYVTYKMQNFGNTSVRRMNIETTCGQLCIRHTVFDTLGGFLPWSCAADAEMGVRAGKFFKKITLNRVLMKRRIHGKNLTVASGTNMKSTLRMANLSYITNVTKQIRSLQKAVAVRITNSFVTINDKDTPFTLSKFPFPKLDVAYQNGVTTVYPIKNRTDIGSVSSVLGRHYIYGEEVGRKAKPTPRFPRITTKTKKLSNSPI